MIRQKTSKNYLAKNSSLVNGREPKTTRIRLRLTPDKIRTPQHLLPHPRQLSCPVQPDPLLRINPPKNPPAQKAEKGKVLLKHNHCPVQEHQYLNLLHYQNLYPHENLCQTRNLLVPNRNLHPNRRDGTFSTILIRKTLAVMIPDAPRGPDLVVRSVPTRTRATPDHKWRARLLLMIGQL